MSFLVPIGILFCSALWLVGLKALWARALLLASLLALLFVLLPSVSQDSSLVNLAIYQLEARAFAERVALLIESGDYPAAARQLRAFSTNQNWATANDPVALRGFYESVAAGTAASASSAIAPAPR